MRQLPPLLPVPESTNLHRGTNQKRGEEGKEGEKDPLYTDVAHSFVKMKGCF